MHPVSVQAINNNNTKKKKEKKRTLNSFLNWTNLKESILNSIFISIVLNDRLSDLWNIMLSEISQTQKVKYCMNSMEFKIANSEKKRAEW